jgi:hypothetical protein
VLVAGGFAMRKSVYFKAAELIGNDKRRSCCLTIAKVCDDRGIGCGEATYYRHKFSVMFYTPNESAFWYGPFTPRNQLARSLALLLMDQIKTHPPQKEQE